MMQVATDLQPGTYRIIAEFRLETEDGDSFPNEVSPTISEALRELVERALDNGLPYLGAVRTYESVSVEYVNAASLSRSGVGV